MEKRKELREFLDIVRKVEEKENDYLSWARNYPCDYDAEYEAYDKLCEFVFSDEIDGRLHEIFMFDTYEPDLSCDDDYHYWKKGVVDAAKEVECLLSEEYGTSYRVNRQIIEEFCDKHMSPHTDWTGTRVETKGKCDSVDDFVDKLMEYIEENQHKY